MDLAGDADIRFLCGDAFTLDLDGPYDLVHDSGCFHHLPPHRRVTYRAFLDRCLAPGGHLSLTGFAAGAPAVGSETPDADLYRVGSLEGGLAFTSEELRWIFADLTEVEQRRMKDGTPYFGDPTLRTALFCKS